MLVYCVLTLSYSCGLQDDNTKDEPPYYSFNQEDYPFLLDGYNVANKRLVFKNQNNEELSFLLRSFEQEKEVHSIGSGLGPPVTPTIIFYYDRRKIEFAFEQFNEPFGNLEFTFNRFRDTLRGGIRFPLWNVDHFFTSTIPIDFEKEEISMTVNNVVYNNVIKINSEDTTVQYTIGPFSRNVNLLYYDKYEGLIGFDDLDGGLWRLE
jgi:hypothetical protein